jgi:diaminopimelate epimerase
MMMAYIHPTKNEKVKDYYKVKKVSFTSDAGIDQKSSEEWMKILNPDKVKFEFYPLEERLDEEIKDIYETTHVVDNGNEHCLIQKDRVTKLSLNEIIRVNDYTAKNYPRANFCVSIGKGLDENTMNRCKNFRF